MHLANRGFWLRTKVRFAGDNLFERFARVAKANVNKVQLQF